MENVTTQRYEGEIKVTFEKPVGGKMTFADLGLTREQLTVTAGHIRVVFELGQIQPEDFYQMPTIEVYYEEKEGETFWEVDFNEETVIEKKDPSGHATVILLNKSKLEGHVHHHNNNLVLHAEFPDAVHISPEKSYINILK